MYRVPILTYISVCLLFCFYRRRGVHKNLGFHEKAYRWSMRLPLRQLTKFNNAVIPDSKSLTGRILPWETVLLFCNSHCKCYTFFQSALLSLHTACRHEMTDTDSYYSEYSMNVQLPRSSSSVSRWDNSCYSQKKYIYIYVVPRQVKPRLG